MRAPNSCPMCGETDGWVHIDTVKKGFNAKNAVIGGVLLGGVGLFAGAGGKKKSLYICKKCEFQHEYNGEAIKNVSTEQKMKDDGFKNNGPNKIWIDKVIKATPDCQFCGELQELYVKNNFNGGDYSFRCAHCMAEFRCNFSFGGKVIANSVSITDCGNVNYNGLEQGLCEANLLIKEYSIIKLKRNK